MVIKKIRDEVWRAAHNRCQFEGCGEVLNRTHEHTRRATNKSQIAHIVAAKPGAARGDSELSEKLENDPANLMLLCYKHHRLIDQDERDYYTVQRLKEMKRANEERSARALDFKSNNASHILWFRSPIAQGDIGISVGDCDDAMRPDFYPAREFPIDLSATGNSEEQQEGAIFGWQMGQLRTNFAAKVQGLRESGKIQHLSIFAIAPIPMLIELGRLLSDQSPAKVYQLQRDTQKWEWPMASSSMSFVETQAPKEAATVALKLELSGSISDDRVISAIGSDSAIWSIKAEQPGVSCLKSERDLIEFKKATRNVLALIRDKHGQDTTIHLFPAIPISAAIEFGRFWMPKADCPVVIYDQVSPKRGFVRKWKLGEINET